ncbi:hypothetical protein D3C72_1035830 [compost metagenome]
MTTLFGDKAFDVENALVLYAHTYATLPAFGIYDDDLLAPIMDEIRQCHIYLVGLTPKIDFVGASQEDETLITSFEIAGNPYELRWPIPPGSTLERGVDANWYVRRADGACGFPDEGAIGARLSAEHSATDFRVLYVGQAYGEDGSRNALDRLRKHETLQKIALQGIPTGFHLSLLMLAIQPGNRLITVFNPRAADKSKGPQRIRNGLVKLFNTSESERTTLYEASLIRYFQPPFNKVFKGSFPSTNLKVLADCYDKDFAAVVAEISIDDLPFRLYSDTVPRKWDHIAKHDLHDDAARRVFFF